MQPTVFELPSGAQLNIGLAPFAKAKALYQALLAEFKGVPLTAQVDAISLVKDVFCSGFSSPRVDEALKECMVRCTIDRDGVVGKVTMDSFESAEARQDYIPACVEVTKANVLPFLKSLFAAYTEAATMIGSIQRSTPETTT